MLIYKWFSFFFLLFFLLYFLILFQMYCDKLNLNIPFKDSLDAELRTEQVLGMKEMVVPLLAGILSALRRVIARRVSLKVLTFFYLHWSFAFFIQPIFQLLALPLMASPPLYFSSGWKLINNPNINLAISAVRIHSRDDFMLSLLLLQHVFCFL